MEEQASSTAFEIWRLDDNGNEFLAGRFDDRITAEKRIAELSAGGHRQTYWLKEVSA